MANQNRNNKTAARLRQAPQPAKPQAPPSNPAKQWLAKALGFKSLLVTAVLTGIVYYAVDKNTGYNWVWNNLLKGNYTLIRENRNATLDERMQMKLGFDYSFLNYIKKNTPDDAVILLPAPEHIMEKAGNLQLTGSVAAKMWAVHFVYPRRIVYKNEAETNPLYREVTHVAICAGHGYEDLDYPVQEHTTFAIYPKRIPNQN
jgi:hypothetical protein